MLVGDNFERARHIINLALNEHAHISYSQFGEDLLVEVLFHSRVTPGFYVDIGAHHPQRFSNTYLLHVRGWRGINVDGDPDLIAAFKASRPADTNISAFVSDKSEDVTFNRFSDTAVNTISDEKTVSYSSRWSVVSSETVRTRTLKEILDEHLPAGQAIDLLSVDVEGVDLKVLKGNDWDRYRPQHIVTEVESLDLMNAGAHPMVAYLQEQGYRLSGLIHVSAFFSKVR